MADDIANEVKLQDIYEKARIADLTTSCESNYKYIPATNTCKLIEVFPKKLDIKPACDKGFKFDGISCNKTTITNGQVSFENHKKKCEEGIPNHSRTECFKCPENYIYEPFMNVCLGPKGPAYPKPV